jgi:hypothetical protein
MDRMTQMRMAQIQRNQVKIAETIERNREVMEITRAKAAKYGATARMATLAIEEARRELQKMGFLKR